MKWLTWPGLESWSGLGTAVCRVVLGIVMVAHGWEKVSAGRGTWTRLGSEALAPFGLSEVAPTAFGATASFIEFFGGFFLVIGFATRPTAFLTAIVLALTTSMQFGRITAYDPPHAIAIVTAFTLLMFAGPGSFSVDSRLSR